MAEIVQIRADIDNEPFVLDDSAEVVDGLKLAASQGAVTVGAVLGEVSATPGIYKLCDYTAQDGSNVPKKLLATPSVADSVSVTENLSGYNEGLFDENQLVFASGTDIDSRLDDELMPNQVDRDFSGASTWENVDINAYDETDDLTITANAIGQYCTLPVASFPTEIGKQYKMTYDLANIASTWTVKSFDGVQTIGTIAANATQGVLVWTAETTGGLRLVSVANDSSGDFDNFTLSLSGENTDYSMRDLLDNAGIRLAPGISVSKHQNPIV